MPALEAFSRRGHVAAHAAPLTPDDWSAIRRSLARRTHGVIPSRKNDALVAWRTAVERDLFLLLEVDPAVASYESLPEKLVITVDGKSRTHVPTALIRSRRARPAIVDVFRSLADPDGPQSRLADLLHGVYARRGIPYCALDRDDVRLQPRLANAVHAVDRGKRPAPPHLALLLTGAVTQQPGASVAELQRVLPQEADVDSAIYAMTMQGLLALDLAAATPSDMAVRLNRHGGR